MKKAEITGSYAVANSKFNERGSGHFYITLKDITFEAKLSLDNILKIQPEIDGQTITYNYHESIYSNDEVLKELQIGNADVPKPYAYYYNYLNKVIKDRLANEMAISFIPLISKRLEQLLRPTVLFPIKNMMVPNANAIITPGIRVSITDTCTNTVLKYVKFQIL